MIVERRVDYGVSVNETKIKSHTSYQSHKSQFRQQLAYQGTSRRLAPTENFENACDSIIVILRFSLTTRTQVADLRQQKILELFGIQILSYT